jgi:16S rRNA (guanine966-N2)-methyltransferase
MTRIIAGAAGGRRLATPPGASTRPTTDRVREALFSAVESRLGSLHGLRCLDLYAGSGAVGLEAASRGASSVTLVERDTRTCGVLRANVRAVGLPGVEVVCGPVSRFLAGRCPAAYDLVFLDPPYVLAGERVRGDLVALASGDWLAESALVIAERSARAAGLGWPPGYEPGRVRAYGETVLLDATWVGYGPARPDDSIQPRAHEER